MIQFNLLPDVKVQYIKARRIKRMMTLVSAVIIAASLIVFTLMMTTVNVVQKKSLSDLNKDIKNYSTQLKNTPDLNKILTVQNQLSTLTDLHNKNPVSSRVFSYLAQLTPEKVSFDKMTLDFTQSTVVMTGTAPGLENVNAFTDTLKATKFTSTTVTESTPAFTNVVLTSFGRDSKSANFTITTSFIPTIFDSTEDVKLIIPAGPRVDPATLFQAQKGGS